MAKQEEYVLRTVEERGIRFIRLWFTDVLGFLKSFAITPAELATAFQEGMQFDGSAIDGFSRVQEADMLAVPDPTTFQILPWRGEQDGVARMFCNIVMPDGEPFEGDPRSVLQRNLQRAADLGFSFYIGPEVEYFYFADSGPEPEVLDRGGYFDLTPLDVAQEYRRRTIMTLESLGIPVESSHHEVAPSQHELDLRYTDALTMADNLMTTRLAVKEVALEHGIYATFMPKPMEGFDGNALHLHLSLFEGDRNAFHEPSAEYGLSKVARGFIAGLLAHGKEITAVTNQWVNSVQAAGRRIRGAHLPDVGTQQPVGTDPGADPQEGQDHQHPYRVPGGRPCDQPLSGLLCDPRRRARGDRRQLRPSPETTSNVHEHTDTERVASGVGRLPETLAASLDAMEDSELVAGALGEHVFEWFLRNKRLEWDRYQRHVSRYELLEYLPIL